MREIRSFTTAALLTGFYLATSLYIAFRRPLWFDEIITMLFARLPGTVTICKTASQIDPWVPVSHYLVVHFFQNILGANPIAIRLPSAIAVALGLLITFDCARRLSDGLHGLIAAALLSCTLLPYYGYEARSYGLYFMLTALSFWLWTRPDISKASVTVFGAVVFLACAVHPYAILCLPAYALSDLLSRRRWMPSPKVSAGMLGACLAIGVLAIQWLAFRRTTGSLPRPHPSLHMVEQAYAEIFPSGLFVLVLIAIWVALIQGRDSTEAAPSMHSAERAGWFCLAIPFAGLVLANPVTNGSPPRYFIGMLPGVAVAFVCLIWRYFNRVRPVAVGIFVLLAGVGVARQLQSARHPESIDPYGQLSQTREFLRLEDALQNEGKKFILWDGHVLYLTAQYYSHHQERYVILRPDGEGDSADRWNNILGFIQYHPDRIWTMRDLQEHVKETAVVHPALSTLNAMQKAGFQANTRYTAPVDVVYFK